MEKVIGKKLGFTGGLRNSERKIPGENHILGPTSSACSFSRMKPVERLELAKGSPMTQL